MSCPFKTRKLGAILAHRRQYRRTSLVYLVTSSQFFIRPRDKQAVRDCKIDPFFSFLSLTPGDDESYAIFWVAFVRSRNETRTGLLWKKEAISLSVYACFAREGNIEMTSPSKLTQFSCIVVHGPKKLPKGTTSEGKIRGQKRFRQSNQGTSESLFMRKTFWGLGALYLILIYLK